MRIVDKSSAGREGFRLEVWVRSDKEENEDLKKIKEFIEKEYGSKNMGNFQSV